MTKHLRAFVLGAALMAAFTTLAAQSFPPTSGSPVSITPSPGRFPLGSSGAPSITLGDAVTGLYSAGTGLLNTPSAFSAGQLTTANAVVLSGGQVRFTTGIVFASLGTPADGYFVFCPDCTKATPCAGSGTGAFAKRVVGAWDCN